MRICTNYCHFLPHLQLVLCHSLYFEQISSTDRTVLLRCSRHFGHIFGYKLCSPNDCPSANGLLRDLASLYALLDIPPSVDAAQQLDHIFFCPVDHNSDCGTLATNSPINKTRANEAVSFQLVVYRGNVEFQYYGKSTSNVRNMSSCCFHLQTTHFL